MNSRDARALHGAVLEGDIKLVRRLIREGSDLDEKDGGGATALHTAARVYAVGAARELLAAGAAVDSRDNFGNTPLSTATFESRGRGELIGLLLNAGADRRAMNLSGVTPLQLAKRIENFDVARFFAMVPAEELPPAPALHAAARQDSAEAVASLLMAGAAVDSFNRAGQTALHVAAESGSAHAAAALIEAGATVDARDDHGRTPLYLATSASQNVAALVMLLRGAGADPLARDELGSTPNDLGKLHDDDIRALYSDVADLGKPNDATPLVPNMPCFAVRSISESRTRAGVMYRRENGWWQFMEGNESDELLNDPSNTVVTSLRSVVDHDPTVLEYLAEPVGTYLVRGKDDRFWPPK